MMGTDGNTNKEARMVYIVLFRFSLSAQAVESKGRIQVSCISSVMY